MKNDKTTLNEYKNLRLWNGIMGLLHLIQGFVMLLLSRESLFQVVLNLPKPDVATRSFKLVAENWYQVNLGYVISSFLFLSAAAHFITILPRVYEWYIENLKNKINLIRWYEYAISSSVMIYVVATLCNINDGLTLLLIVGVNACMNLFGASMEMHNSSLRKLAHNQTVVETVLENGKKVAETKHAHSTYKVNWSSFIYGCFAGILPWVVMGMYFFVTLDRLGELGDLPQRIKDTLNTVRFIFPALFVFFNCFAINMVLQYKEVGPWKNYVHGEKVYILLSLIAKSFLAWFIWGGTLRP
jgi:Heliorhodopsin